MGKGGVEIVLNESSLRSSKPVVNFRGEERNLGDAAANIERQCLNNSAKDITRLVGITPDQWEAEKKWWNMPLKFENNIPVVTLEVNGEQVDFTIERLLAMVLTKFSNDCKLSMTSFHICITHPIYFDQYQKSVLKAAAEISGVDCIKITPETTALSFQYGLFRKRELTKEMI